MKYTIDEWGCCILSISWSYGASKLGIYHEGKKMYFFIFLAKLYKPIPNVFNIALKMFPGDVVTRDGHADAERLPIRKIRRNDIRHMLDISDICRIYPTYPNRCASPKISAWPSLVKISTKDTSFHSFFAFFSLLEKTETLDKKGDPHTKKGPL